MFIEFTRIEFRNYKSIKEGTLILNDQDVILVQGTNNDKGGSNGAGKSILKNGLLWCLFDRTLLGKETEEEIIPKFVSKKEFNATDGCCVSVYFKRDDVKYIISRYRKHPVHKNTTVVLKYDGVNAYKDISKCTDKETNALIVDIIGANFDSFVHSNIFSFSNIEPFLAASDKDKKELILPKHFVTMFKAAYKKCSEEIKEVEDFLGTIGEELLTCSIQKSAKENEFTLIVQNIQRRNKELQIVKDKITKEINLKCGVEASVVEATKKSDDCNAEFIKLLELREEHKKDEMKWASNSSKLIKFVNKKTIAERDMNAKKLELEEYKNSSNDSLVSKLTELSKTSKEKGDLFDKLSKQIDACEKTLKIRKGILADVLKTKTSLNETFSQYNTELAKISNEQVSLSAKKLTVSNQERDIKDRYYSEECKTCSNNKMTGFFAGNKEKLLSIDRSFSLNQSRILEIQEEVDKLKEDGRQVESLEARCQDSIDVIEKEELAGLHTEALIVKRALHELKTVIDEIKLKVEDANKVLLKISSISKDIDVLTEVLDRTAFVIQELEKLEIKANIERCVALAEEDNINYEMVDKKRYLAQNELNSHNTEILVIEERIKGLKNLLNVTDDLELQEKRAKLDIQNFESEKLRLDGLNSEFNNKLDLLKFWKIGFSPAGIEGFMMDSLINAMNSLIAKYLSFLTDNTISLTLIPDKKLKTGDARNKISEKVENDFGGKTYRTNSEGEKRVMDIAVLFALKFIYEKITGTKYNILFCDEAFDTLDASTCRLVINLIHSLDGISSIFVISHIDDIALEFENFVNVIKTKGVTEIVRPE